MRALSRSRMREGIAVLTALAVILVAAVAVGVSPAGDRPEVAVVLLVVAALAGGVVGAILYARRLRTRHRADEAAQAVVEAAWFSGSSLEGYPEQGVAKLLPATGGPSEERLHSAWVMATHGHDAGWLERHLEVPGEVARLLADTARERRSGQGAV